MFGVAGPAAFPFLREPARQLGRRDAPLGHLLLTLCPDHLQANAAAKIDQVVRVPVHHRVGRVVVDGGFSGTDPLGQVGLQRPQVQ